MRKALVAAVLFIALGGWFYGSHLRAVHAQNGTKRVIVLTQSTTGTSVVYNVLFWFVITKQPVAQPGSAGSAWSASGTSQGASTAENLAIANGTIMEEPQAFTFPVGTPTAAIQAVIQQGWVNRNNQVNGQGANQFYGVYFDGSTWAAQ